MFLRFFHVSVRDDSAASCVFDGLGTRVFFGVVA